MIANGNRSIGAMVMGGRSPVAPAAPVSPQPAKAARPYLLSDFGVGVALSILFTLFVLVDLFCRPAFVAINIKSEIIARDSPMIVWLPHFALNAAFALPCLYGAATRGMDLRRCTNFGIISIAFTIVAALSLFAFAQAMPVAMVAVLAFNLALPAIFIATKYRGEEAMRGLLGGLAIGGVVTLLLVLWVGEYAAGRLVSHAGPNFWGRIALIAFCGSLCVKRMSLRALTVALSLLVLLLTSSRGSMLGAIAAGAIMFFLHARKVSGFRLGIYMILGLFVVAASPWLLEKLFYLSDPERGLSSGGTGRSLAWAQAWQAFLSSPWIGIGFRRHEQYVTVATSAHNAYLATLAEVGLIGFTIYLVFVLGATVRSVRHAFRQPDQLVLAAVASYMCGFVALGFVETEAMSTGSPASLVMFFVAAQAWRPLAPRVPRLSGQRP